MGILTAVIHASLRNRAVVLVGTLLFVILGIQAALRLPIDAVPDVTNVQVQVITAAPALSPIEVEQYVTVAVERAMSGIPKVTQIRSISKYGLSVVTIVFTDETPIYLARQLVSERMREAESAVPAQYGKPELGPITSGLGEVYQFVVRGRSLMEVEETLDWYIGPQLRTVPGIVESNSFGGENKEYQIHIDPSRLQAAGMSVHEIATALERSNANAGGGYIEHNREQYVIGSIGLIRSLEDLQTVVVGATPQGVPITLAHLGEVRFGPRLRRGAASMDGQGEVAVGVALMLLGENSRTVTAAVKAKLAEITPSLPAGIHVEPFYDRAELVNRTIRTVVTNLLEGAALVVLVLLVLLGDLRAGLIVATTIPLSMLFAMLAMNLLGLSGNLMSLGAIDFGLIVDGAVIIVENTVRHLGLSQKARAQARPLTPQERTAVVQDAAVEVRSATIFGEAIIAIVYLPILALIGIEGKLFRPMATTVLFALLGAFLFSLTVVPALCSLLLRPSTEPHEGRLLNWVQQRYDRVLDKSLRHRAVALTAGVLMLAAGVALGLRLGAEFVPQLDEGDLLIEARRLPGVSLTESLAIDQRLQRVILGVPEVAHVVSRIGSPELATDPMGIEQSDVYVILKPRKDWRAGMTKARIGEQIQEALAERVPEVAGAVSQPIQMRTNELIAGVRSDVAAQIYGPDLTRLKALGEQVAEAVKTVPGAADVRAEQNAGLSYIRIYPDRARLARYGLSLEEVNELTQTLAVGLPVGTVFEGERRFGMVVRIPVTFDGAVEALRALPLKSSIGQMVPLGDVAQVVVERGPVLVNREKQSRRLIVELNVRGRDLLSVVQDARAAVAQRVKLPPGYRIEWGGQFQHFTEARERLQLVVPLSLLLILFMLWLAFRSVRPALLIFFNIPFAAVGGVVALQLRQIPFSISAGVGFIALFGVSVLNGLVLVTFSRRMEEAGTPPAEAIREAARIRLRPVLMTALVASLGFLPMALSTAPGSEIQRPLATVVIGGLLSATALTLLLFPVLYGIFGGRAAPERADA